MTTTAVKQAVIEQIHAKAEEKQIPVTWLLTKLGIKQRPNKKRPLAKYELVKAIELRLHAFISSVLPTLTTKEVKALIVPDEETPNKLIGIFSEIPLKVDVEEAAINLKVKYIEAVNALELPALWNLLEEINKYEATETVEETPVTKQPKTDKGGYVSVPEEVAKSLIATYYQNIASNASVCTPECFRGGRVTNHSHAFRRLIFSNVCKDRCKVFNSVPKAVYDWYTENTKEEDVIPADEAETIIEAYHKANPDYLNKVKSWETEKYVSAVVKK